MKAIPDLELSSQVDNALSQTSILPDSPLPVSPLPGMSMYLLVHKPFIQIVGHNKTEIWVNDLRVSMIKEMILRHLPISFRILFKCNELI